MNSNKFRMVYKVDGNPQLGSRDWSMYSNILNRFNSVQKATDLKRKNKRSNKGKINEIYSNWDPDTVLNQDPFESPEQ